MSMLTTHIIVADAARAAEWYCSVLGASECSRITLADGRLIHVELQFGPSVVMMASEFPEHGALAPTSTGCTSAVFYLEVPDVDDTWRRALEAGATVHRPLADAFWGDRDGQIIDPFGHRWGLSQHIRDVSIEEMSELAAQAFAPATD